MKDKMKQAGKSKFYLLLHILLAVYSLTGVCSKLASEQEFMSPLFILFYGLVIANLGLYAFFWQQLLKHLNLTTAFCNKAITILWGILWGVLFFGETVQWNMILGGAIVIIGVIMVVSSDG